MRLPLDRFRHALAPLIHLQQLLDRGRNCDFVALLALRLYLAPVFWMAGSQKFNNFAATVEWFGNAEWGLGLPFPVLLAFLVTTSELLGAICLLLGLAVRWNTIPLIITMLVAIFSVHWQNGWLAIASGQGIFASERTIAAAARLSQAQSILKEHGDYGWLTEHGHFVVLNNGIEFAVTYLAMLLVLFCFGGGRFISLDYWIKHYCQSADLFHAPSGSKTPDTPLFSQR